METKQESPRVSPVGPAPLPPKKVGKTGEVEKMYAVFAEGDIKSSWHTLDEAHEIAEDAAQRYGTMLIFQLVGKEHKR